MTKLQYPQLNQQGDAHSELIGSVLKFRPSSSRKTITWIIALTGLCAAILIVASILFNNVETAQTIAMCLIAILALTGLWCILGITSGMVSFGDSKTVDYNVRSALDTYADAIALVNIDDGSIEYSNLAFARLSAANGKVTSLADILPNSSDFQAAIYRASTSLKKGDTHSDTVRIFDLSNIAFFDSAKDGWIRISAHAVENADGKMAMWKFEDVTAAGKPTTDSYLDLEASLHHLDQVPAGLLSINNDQEILYYNATLSSWLGYTNADADDDDNAPKTLSDLIGGQIPTNLDIGKSRDLKNTTGSNPTRVFDVTLRRKDWSQMNVRMLTKRTYSNDGIQLGQQHVILERELSGDVGNAGEFNSHLASQLFEMAPIGLAIVTQNGSITQSNHQFNNLFSSQDLIGNDLSQLLPVESRLNLSRRLAEVTPGIADPNPIVITRDRGKARSVYLHIYSLESDPTGTGRVAVYATDMTEHHALEQQFAQSQRVQAIGQLAGGIAHDFNNLLTAILGFSEIMLERVTPSDSSFHDLQKVRDNANRAADLVRRLLAFSRRQTLNPKVLDLNEKINDLQGNLMRLIGPNIKLSTNFERELWQVLIDEVQFDQLIMNLSVNARDAMPNGGNLTVKTSNVSKNQCASFNYTRLIPADYVMCEVTDTGFGISSSDVDQIFEPYYTTKDVGEGTGLGLSQAYGFTKQSGGFIFVESQIDVGTVFRIFFPQNKPEKQVNSEIVDLRNGNAITDARGDSDSHDTFEKGQRRGKYLHEDSDPSVAGNNRVILQTPPVSSSDSIGNSRREVSESTSSATKSDQSNTAETAVAARSGSRDLTGSGTVLLVEDEEGVRMFTAQALRSRGFEVYEAVNGESALELLRKDPDAVDLVVSDVVMPEMDGPTMFAHMLKIKPDVKVIFISGYARDAFKHNLAEGTKHHFLPKPYSFRDLVAKVKAVMEDDSTGSGGGDDDKTDLAHSGDNAFSAMLKKQSRLSDMQEVHEDSHQQKSETGSSYDNATVETDADAASASETTVENTPEVKLTVDAAAESDATVEDESEIDAAAESDATVEDESEIDAPTPSDASDISNTEESPASTESAETISSDHGESYNSKPHLVAVSSTEISRTADVQEDSEDSADEKAETEAEAEADAEADADNAYEDADITERAETDANGHTNIDIDADTQGVNQKVSNS